MPGRAASPALSEAEVDILGSLYPGEEAHQHHGAGEGGLEFDVDGILNAPVAGQDGGDDGDEAFIALQQAASYRKGSNLKGRTVKKGGGFQAMGEAVLILTCALNANRRQASMQIC